MAQTYDLPALPGNLFDVKREGNEIKMVAELSDLEIRPGQRFLHQIYPDACDMGIAIGGKRETVIFYLSDTDENKAEGEIYGWHFKPISEAIRKNADLAHLSVLLIND